MLTWADIAADMDWGADATNGRWSTPGDLAQAVTPGTKQTPALELIDRALVDVENGKTKRLIISMPPQEGKSTRVTQTGALWFLIRNPTRRIAIACYSQELANDFSRTIRNLIDVNNGEDDTLDLGLRIARDNGAMNRWQLDGSRGGVKAVGVGAGLTGHAVDALFIDDPISNSEQAMSSTYREKVWRWWQSVGVTRLAPGAPVILVLTRWHEDDLAGRLIKNDLDQEWTVVSIPAIADSNDDPLGREIGEPMISARDKLLPNGDWVRRDFNDIKVKVGEYTWSALYQQRPAPAEGGLFTRKKLSTWKYAPDGELGRRIIVDGTIHDVASMWRFVTADLATSLKTSADFTAAAAWGVTIDGHLVLLEPLLERLEPTKHFEALEALRARWEADTLFVESAWMTSTMAYEAGRAGVPLQELRPDKDKFTRALPAASMADAARLWLPPSMASTVMDAWIDQLVEFPNAAHDDAVDATAWAAQVVATRWVSSARMEQMMPPYATPSPVDMGYMGLEF